MFESLGTLAIIAVLYFAIKAWDDHEATVIMRTPKEKLQRRKLQRRLYLEKQMKDTS